MLVPALVATAGGVTVFAVLRRHGWPGLPSIAGAVALAPGIGFGLLSLAFFFLAFAGFTPPGRWLLAGLSAVLAGAIVAPVVPPVAAGRDGSHDAAGESSAGSRGPLLALLLLAGIGFGLLLWTFPRASAAQPFGAWDAWAIWNVRALFLFRAEDNLGEIFSMLKHGHPDYPLLLPGSLAAQYCLLAGEDLAIPQLTGLLFALGTGALLFFTLWRYSTATAAAAAVAVLGSTPVFWRWAFDQYADIPLAYLLLAASAALASQLDDDPSRRWPPVLTGLCCGLLGWIKNEGLILALLLAAVFAVVLLLPRRRAAGAADRGSDARREALRRLPWIAAGALPPLSALVLFKSFWSPANETRVFFVGAVEKLLNFDRWQVVLAAFWRELNPWSGIASWGLLWPFLVLCVIAFRRRRRLAGRPVLCLGGTVVLAWAAYLAVYVCTPMGQAWHLNRSLDRLLLQLTPLTLTWALAGGGRGETVAAHPAPPHGVLPSGRRSVS